MSQVVGFPNNSYKPITNTAWVRARLCKLQNKVHSTRGRDKVYQVLAHCRWFSSGTPASSTTKTGRHDIVEILLKVAINIINKVKSNYTLNSSGTILYVVCNRLVVVLKYARNGYPFVIYILDPVFMGFFFLLEKQRKPLQT